MNRDDVIDVLSVVAAATRRTVGDADVDVWEAVIGDVPKDLALRAIRDHLRHQPGVWLEPGHVHQRVRAMIRDQIEREPDRDREARQAVLDAKVAEQVQELAESKGIPAFRRREGNSPLAVKCPWCHAGPGQPCVVPRTRDRPAGGMHPSRIEASAALVSR